MVNSKSVLLIAASVLASAVATPTLSEALTANAELKNIQALLNTTKVADKSILATLEAETAATLFAPTNGALAKAPAFLTKTYNSDALLRVLNFHVVPAAVEVDTPIATLNGEKITVLEDGKVSTASANVTHGDVVATANGALYPVEAVLTPKDLGLEYDLASYIEMQAEKNKNTTVLSVATRAEALDSLKEVTDEGVTFLLPIEPGMKTYLAGTEVGKIKPEILKQILDFHTLKGVYTLEDLKAKAFEESSTPEDADDKPKPVGIPTMDGDNEMFVKKTETKDKDDKKIVTYTFGPEKDETALGLAKLNKELVGTDIRVQNGIIHVVDAAYRPKTTSGAATVTSAIAAMFVAAVGAVNLA